MSPDISLSSKPRKQTDVKEEELDGEYLVYDSETETVHNLNPTASFIWSLADGTRSVSFFIEEIHSSDPDIAKDKVRKDVVECLDKLRESGLIELKDDR